MKGYQSSDNPVTTPDRPGPCRQVATMLPAIVALQVFATPAFAVDAVAGRALFHEQCTVCHTAEADDNGGAQGPSLAGVFGRSAGGDPTFSYSDALRKSNLTWDADTLNRFLKAPSRLVPGTMMAVAVADDGKRADLVAYLESESKTASAQSNGSSPAPATAAAQADWKKDAPGRAHRIDLASLPAPFSTSSARNPPRLIARPRYAQLSAPPGFKVGMFAQGLQGPRRMVVAANGDIFLTEIQGGRVSILHPAADGRSARGTNVYVDGLTRPFGIAFYPSADRPEWLYVAETNRVVRFRFRDGDIRARGEPEVVVPDLPTGGHATRDIAFSPDGRQLYVSVGSQSNVAEQMPKKTPAQVKAWESTHALGSSWDMEENRAAVLVFDVDAKRAGKVFATGIRNCVGLTIQPGTDDLWCTTNERDALGDDLVPDYSTRVSKGSFFGWPWYYMGSNEEPRLRGDRPDLKDKVSVPDVPYQAHSAALTLTFYTATSGQYAFPSEYVGDGFAMFHGSWNRGFRTGHKVVRIRMKNGVPTGEYDDFITGFIADDGDAWGRPVAAAVLKDGSLLFSDDGANVIYRVAYEK